MVLDWNPLGEQSVGDIYRRTSRLAASIERSIKVLHIVPLIAGASLVPHGVPAAGPSAVFVQPLGDGPQRRHHPRGDHRRPCTHHSTAAVLVDLLVVL